MVDKEALRGVSRKTLDISFGGRTLRISAAWWWIEVVFFLSQSLPRIHVVLRDSCAPW